MCVRLHQYDMSLMWKYKEQKPSQTQSGPQWDTSSTENVCVCVFVFYLESDKQRATSHNKHQQQPHFFLTS